MDCLLDIAAQLSLAQCEDQTLEQKIGFLCWYNDICIKQYGAELTHQMGLDEQKPVCPFLMENGKDFSEDRTSIEIGVLVVRARLEVIRSVLKFNLTKKRRMVDLTEEKQPDTKKQKEEDEDEA